MDNSIKITLIIVVAILVIGIAGAFLYLDRTSAKISETGSAELKVSPDLVIVYLNAETTGKDAKEANDKNSEMVNQLTDALIKQGFKKEDLETVSLNIYPENVWDNGNNYIKDYKAVHQLKISINVSDKDKVGKVIDAAVNSNVLVSYINFELTKSKENEYKAEALKQATEDAQVKAESIALGLGKKVGKVVSVSDTSFNYNPYPLYTNSAMSSDYSAAKEAATNIQPSSLDISASVSVTYNLN